VSAATPLLELDRLSTGYGKLTAVSNVSLRVAPGEVVALFGPNGAGKTSTLLATVGVLPRRSGQVEWCGASAPKSLHAFTRAGLAFVPETRSIISSLSTRDNLRLGRGTVEAALEYFPVLTRYLDRRAGLLSGGEQQILMLARALAARPRLLIVDELSLGLAPRVVERLLTALRQAAEDEGLAVLLIEQQMRRALAVADRWYLLKNGTVTADGKADAAGTAILQKAYLASIGIKEGPS
jgi:branched-chain amino acid transport system ATP-binding protein